MPAGTPAAIVSRLNAEMNKALAEGNVRDGFLQSAQDPVGGTPAAFQQLLQEDFQKYERLVRELAIKVN